MLSFSYLSVAASLILFGCILWRLKSIQDTHKIAASCLWLGAYACFTNSPILSPLIESEMVVLGQNLSLYVGFPIMALIMLDVAMGWQWQRATWGRIFLALAAMFELMRRAENGAAYGEFILWICLLALLWSIYRIIRTARLQGQASNRLYIGMGFYFALMMVSLGSFNTGTMVLWSGLTLLAFGGYLYFVDSTMALASPSESPK
jgi:hypothetical protein